MSIGKNTLKRRAVARPVMVAICGLLLLAATAAAAGSLYKYVSGWGTTKEYTAPPSQAQLQKDAGFAAKIPDTLPGGFKLAHASVATHMQGSDNGIAMDDKRKIADGMYKREGLKPECYVTLSASNDDSETPVAQGAHAITLGGKTAHWWEYTLHVVPSGYEPSEEMAKERAGTLVTVYVSSKDSAAPPVAERTQTVKALKWQDGGISYVLRDTGCGLALDELVTMGEAIIATK